MPERAMQQAAGRGALAVAQSQSARFNADVGGASPDSADGNASAPHADADARAAPGHPTGNRARAGGVRHARSRPRARAPRAHGGFLDAPTVAATRRAPSTPPPARTRSRAARPASPEQGRHRKTVP